MCLFERYKTEFLILLCLVINPTISKLGLKRKTKTRSFVTDDTRRVVNGLPAKLGDVPYQVSIKEGFLVFRSVCGGVLISPRKILSAAHCFIQETRFFGFFSCLTYPTLRDMVDTFAVTGHLKTAGKRRVDSPHEPSQWRRVLNVTAPETYRFPHDDICILFTYFPFIVNANIKPIPYAKEFREYAGTCVLSGYGRINKMDDSKVLLIGQVEMLSSLECNDYFETYNNTKLICTSIRLADTGAGDSGGPLVCSGTGEPGESPDMGVLVGIVSGAIMDEYDDGVSFYTRTASYVGFIERNRGAVGRAHGVWFRLVVVAVYRRWEGGTCE